MSWRDSALEAQELLRELDVYRRGLGHVTEADVDAALDSEDVIGALRVLAVRNLEREMVSRAISRLRGVKSDLDARARLVKRRGSVITSGLDY